MPTATQTVKHAVTIEQLQLPAGTPLRASCLCDWQSPILPSRRHAKDAGNQHLARSASTAELIEDLARRGVHV